LEKSVTCPGSEPCRFHTLSYTSMLRTARYLLQKDELQDIQENIVIEEA